MSAAPKPAFVITIDTEGDNLWAAPATVTTENAHDLLRFQALCERYRLAPTWLTNYEMAESAVFRELGRDVLRRDTGEIGMHLHAWNSPPLTADDDPKIHAYLIEYAPAVMREKIARMTDVLASRFGRRPVSHRAGRWAFDSCYARLLVEHGYVVDCSVTPHVSWATFPGRPAGAGGTDYTAYPARPYFLDLDRLDCEGSSSLLEVPVSIVTRPNPARCGGRDAPSTSFPPCAGGAPVTTWWLRPNGRNLDAMLGILDRACEEHWPCVEFMLHSSELMPGGSPTFKTAAHVEALYDDLEILFTAAADRFRGATLSAFHRDVSETRAGITDRSRSSTAARPS